MTLWPFALVGASLVSVVILIGVFSLAITVFWLWMLIDALTNKKLKGTDHRPVSYTGGPEEWKKVFENQGRTKVQSLIELIEEAKKRAGK